MVGVLLAVAEEKEVKNLEKKDPMVAKDYGDAEEWGIRVDEGSCEGRGASFYSHLGVEQ